MTHRLVGGPVPRGGARGRRRLGTSRRLGRPRGSAGSRSQPARHRRQREHRRPRGTAGSAGRLGRRSGRPRSIGRVSPPAWDGSSERARGCRTGASTGVHGPASGSGRRAASVGCRSVCGPGRTAASGLASGCPAGDSGRSGSATFTPSTGRAYPVPTMGRVFRRLVAVAACVAVLAGCSPRPPEGDAPVGAAASPSPSPTAAAAPSREPAAQCQRGARRRREPGGGPVRLPGRRPGPVTHGSIMTTRRRTSSPRAVRWCVRSPTAWCSR